MSAEISRSSANFDGYIYSYEVGGMKPHPEIYAAMEKTDRPDTERIWSIWMTGRKT